MLSFDPIKHEYRWNGARVPSVTQILHPLSDFSMVNPVVLDASRDLGVAVHAMIDLDVRRDLDEDSLDGPLPSFLCQWRAFLSDTGFKPLRSELKLYSSRYGFAGTLDLFGELDGHQTLIDTKSGAVPKTARPQTAGYKQLLEEAGIGAGRPIRRRALDLKADSWRLLPEYKDPNDLRVFLAALTLHNFKAAA